MPRIADKAGSKPNADKTPADPQGELDIKAPEREPEEPDLGFSGLGDADDYNNVLYYGREGSGKTSSALRMANLGQVLVINAEGGLRKRALANRGIDTTNIRQWPDKTRGEKFSFNGLLRAYRKVKTDLAADPDSWAGTVFDSATEIHQAILDSVSNRRVKALKDEGRDNVDEYFVDISDYGTMTKMFRKVLRDFRDLPCHFAVTALERRTADKDTGKVIYGPAVTPGLQSDMLGYVDFALVCKQADEDGPFRALTKGSKKYRAKDRDDVLPRVLVDPFFDRLHLYTTGALTEEADATQEKLLKDSDVDKPIKDDSDDADEDAEA